jgi:phosphoserine phosphatase
MSAEERRLDELENKADELRRGRQEHYDQVNRWREERDRLNESVKRLREEAARAKEERDAVNAKVAELKRGLEPLFQRLEEKRGRLTEAEQRLRREARSLPDRGRLEKDLRRIEWEVMTTPTAEMQDREDELMGRAQRLSRTLEEFKGLDRVSDQRMDSLADVKAIEIEIRSIRDGMHRLHEESQGHHEMMLLLYRKADEERERANQAHARFVESLEAAKAVNEELDAAMDEVRQLREGLRLEDVRHLSQRRMSTEARAEEMRREALRKMEVGSKLTFEEMRLIYGDENEIEE